jgi:hypothetical protein
MTKNNATAFILLGICVVSFGMGIYGSFFHSYFYLLFMVLAWFSGSKSVDYRFTDDSKELK